MFYFFFFKQKTAYEMRISDWSSDVCSSDLISPRRASAHVLGHSKRAEALVGVMDLALHGIDAEPQSADAVYDELGLMRYPQRSEERRVGKECVSTCRSRWSPDH